MMRDGKVFASLSAGLLARKGEARPAMRPQGFAADLDQARLDDLGWNDMGDAAPPEAPLVLRQQAEIAREFAGPAAAPAADARKSAFTLRLDGERHLRLRLVCAARHRSAQQIVIQALDELLARMPEAERLAASLATADGSTGADRTPGGDPRS
jgi:hypothetical protein